MSADDNERLEYEASSLANLLINPFLYEGWNVNSGNYLFTTDTK